MLRSSANAPLSHTRGQGTLVAGPPLDAAVTVTQHDHHGSLRGETLLSCGPQKANAEAAWVSLMHELAKVCS